MHNQVISQFPIFSKLSLEVIGDISIMLKTYEFVEDEYIYQDHDPAKYINFITKGVMAYVVADEEDLTFALGLENEMFGLGSIEYTAHDLTRTK